MITEEECEKIGLLKMMAAFVDGEGTIAIAMRRTSYGHVYNQTILVANTDIRLVEWLVDNFGGIFPKARVRGENLKDTYLWQLYGSHSYKLIKKIHPYLILKQEQADNAIELWERVSILNYGGNKSMPAHKRKLAEELYHRNKKLNMRGKSEDIEEVEVLVPVNVRKDVLDEWLE